MATLSLDPSENLVLSISLNGNYPNARVIVRLHEIKFLVDGRQITGRQGLASKLMMQNGFRIS